MQDGQKLLAGGISLLNVPGSFVVLNLHRAPALPTRLSATLKSPMNLRV